MDAWNLRNMNRIAGGDPDGKNHLLLDYSNIQETSQIRGIQEF